MEGGKLEVTIQHITSEDLFNFLKHLLIGDSLTT